MTFVNGRTLLKMSPILGMIETKERFEGTSYGLSEAGYDLRIRQKIEFINDAYGSRTVVTDPELNEFTTFNGHFVLASAIEEFNMPKNLVGTVKDKSTWARQGLSVFNTVIEPGWKGFLTLELVYHGNSNLVIEAGSGIAQVLFGSLSDIGDYGDGKYQNQENKPVFARS